MAIDDQSKETEGRNIRAADAPSAPAQRGTFQAWGRVHRGMLQADERPRAAGAYHLVLAAAGKLSKPPQR